MTERTDTEQSPWIAHGLNEREQEPLREAIKSDANLTEDEFLRTLRQSLQESAPDHSPREPAYHRVMQQIKQERRSQPLKHTWRWLAMAACLVVLAQTTFVFKKPGNNTGIPPLGATNTQGPVLQVQFRSDTSMREINAFFTDIGADIIAGPNARGIYKIKLDENSGKSQDQWISELQKKALFNFVAAESP